MRGSKAEDGATRVAQNGYHYTKVNGKWRLTHHIVAEAKLGRPIREDERVVFIGSKTDLSPGNIKVQQKGTSSARRRLAYLEARINELRAEADELRKELAEPIKTDQARNTPAEFTRV
jgi:hypothetical protein